MIDGVEFDSHPVRVEISDRRLHEQSALETFLQPAGKQREREI